MAESTEDILNGSTFWNRDFPLISEHDFTQAITSFADSFDHTRDDLMMQSGKPDVVLPTRWARKWLDVKALYIGEAGRRPELRILVSDHYDPFRARTPLTDRGTPRDSVDMYSEDLDVHDDDATAPEGSLSDEAEPGSNEASSTPEQDSIPDVSDDRMSDVVTGEDIADTSAVVNQEQEREQGEAEQDQKNFEFDSIGNENTGPEQVSEDAFEENDPECLLKSPLNDDKQTRFMFSVILDENYHVPKLYFWRIRKNSVDQYREPTYGRLDYWILGRQNRPMNKRGEIFGAIGIEDHPNEPHPAFFVHPCRTEDRLRDLVAHIPSTGIIGAAYLTMWLGIVGTFVHLYVPSPVVDRINLVGDCKYEKEHGIYRLEDGAPFEPGKEREPDSKRSGRGTA